MKTNKTKAYYVIGLMLMLPAMANAAPIAQSNGFITVGSTYPPVAYDVQTTSTNSSANATYTNTTPAMDSFGNDVTVTVTGSATAATSASALKAGVSVSTFSPVLTTPSILANATSSFQDVITLGSASVSYIQFGIDFHGTLTTLNSAALFTFFEQADARLDQYVFSSPGHLDHITLNVFCDSPLFNPCGSSISKTIMSEMIPVVGSQAELAFQLSVMASIDTSLYAMEGGDYGADADFMNTVNLLDIYAYDANGNLIDAVSATGSGGYQYSLASVPGGNSVPEPSVLALLGIAFGGSIIARRKKRIDVANDSLGCRG